MSELTKPTAHWKDLQKKKLVAMASNSRNFVEIDGLQIVIYPNVYPPGTDSKLMVKTAEIKQGGTALDLCTGTGIIACKLAKSGAESVMAVDLNPRAVANAKENKKLLRLDNLTVSQSNLFDGINEKFDVITINPPYTNKTPANDIEICFYDEGHKMVRRFFAELRQHLKPGGIAYIAWSNISDMELLTRLAKENNFKIAKLAEAMGANGYMFYVYSLKVKYEQA